MPSSVGHPFRSTAGIMCYIRYYADIKCMCRKFTDAVANLIFTYNLSYTYKRGVYVSNRVTKHDR